MTVKRNLLGAAIFLCIAAFLFSRWAGAMQYKYGDGIAGIDIFCDQPKNKMDVIVYGPSTAFENINTAVMWREYGVAGYDLCGSVQPFWNIYYFMKESLKYQTPKVMVVEMSTVAFDHNYIDDSRIIKNNYGMPWSLDKVKSIMISSPRSKRVDFLLEYPTFHSRTDLSKNDFTYYGEITNARDWKGFGINCTVTPQKAADLSNVTERAKLYPKVEEYLRKIIALAKERNIPLVFTAAPHGHDLMVAYAKYYNTVADIAKENDIPFLNGNLHLQEIGMDYNTDFGDVAHMNPSGNTKWTRYVMDYLKAHYDIPDRREDSDPYYRSYDVMLHDYENHIADDKLQKCTDYRTYFTLLQSPEYFVTVSVDGNIAEPHRSEINRLMMTYLHLPDGCVNAGNLFVTDGGKVVHSDGRVTFNQNRADIRYYMGNPVVQQARNMGVDGGGVVGGRLLKVNGRDVKVVPNGINITVADVFTGKVVDVVGIDPNGTMRKQNK